MSSFPPPPPPPPAAPPPPSMPGSGGFPAGPPAQGPVPGGGPATPTPSFWSRKVGGLPIWGLFAVVVLIAGAVVAFVATRSDDSNGGSSANTEETTEASDTTEPSETEETTEPDDTAADTSAPETTDVEDTTEPTTEDTVEPTVATEPPATVDEVDGAPDGVTGTISAPVPGGQIADVGDGWRLQVLGVVPDGAAAVAAEGSFNDPPPAGKTFTLVRVALGYYGLTDPASVFQVDMSAVGAAKVELDTDCGLIPEALDSFNDLFAGAVVTGNLCFVTAPEDAPVLQLYAAGGFDTPQVFLAASSVPDGVTPMPALRGPQPGAAATSTRQAPVAIGTATDIGGTWQFTVNSPAHDITDSITAEGSFNDPPPEGFRFIGVDATYAYNGTESASIYEVTIKAVDDNNVQVSTSCGFVPGEVDYSTDIFAGGTVSGTLCFVVRTEDVASLVVYGTGSFDTNYVMFATK